MWKVVVGLMYVESEYNWTVITISQLKTWKILRIHNRIFSSETKLTLDKSVTFLLICNFASLFSVDIFQLREYYYRCNFEQPIWVEISTSSHCYILHLKKITILKLKRNCKHLTHYMSLVYSFICYFICKQINFHEEKSLVSGDAQIVFTSGNYCLCSFEEGIRLSFCLKTGQPLMEN